MGTRQHPVSARIRHAGEYGGRARREDESLGMARRHTRLPDRPGTVCAAGSGADSGGIHARGTTGAADARRGDRPIGRIARGRTDAHPALHDQRQHRPAERRSGEMRPERHGGGRRKAFRGGEPAAGDLERLHFGRVGHRRRVAADPQRRVRPCLRRGIRPAVRFHRQRIQRLQIGKSRALPPLRRGARRADAGRSRRRGAAHDRPRAFGHGRHRGGRRHLQRREPHIGSFAHGRRTRVRNRRGAPRSVARRRRDRHGQSPTARRRSTTTRWRAGRCISQDCAARPATR